MYDEQFPIRLAKLRTEKGVSARDMSLSIGQNPGYINNIETGKALPSMSSFFFICEYLNITPQDFFDIEWNHLEVHREKHPCSAKVIEQPVNLGKMIRLAEKLSNNIPFLRVDFYIIKRNVYFGELTFFPASGFEKFVPLSSDRQFGDWITLPELEL